MKDLIVYKNISISATLIILIVTFIFAIWAILHGTESIENLLSYIGVSLAAVSIFFGSFISTLIKIHDNRSEIYEIGVDAYNTNNLYICNETFFRQIISKEEKGHIPTLKEQQMPNLKNIISQKVRYAYFLKKSIILKKDADSIYNKLKKWATAFVFCLIIGLIFIITKKVGYDVFIAFEIPLALWILEDMFDSYNNEKQINYEKVNKFIEVTGKLYENGELKEYQDLQEYYEYLLGIYDYDHVEDSNLEPLLPSRYRNKL